MSITSTLEAQEAQKEEEAKKAAAEAKQKAKQSVAPVSPAAEQPSVEMQVTKPDGAPVEFTWEKMEKQEVKDVVGEQFKSYEPTKDGKGFSLELKNGAKIKYDGKNFNVEANTAEDLKEAAKLLAKILIENLKKQGIDPSKVKFKIKITPPDLDLEAEIAGELNQEFKISSFIAASAAPKASFSEPTPSKQEPKPEGEKVTATATSKAERAAKATAQDTQQAEKKAASSSKTETATEAAAKVRQEAEKAAATTTQKAKPPAEGAKESAKQKQASATESVIPSPGKTPTPRPPGART